MNKQLFFKKIYNKMAKWEIFIIDNNIHKDSCKPIEKSKLD